jgi:hypothetical protein
LRRFLNPSRGSAAISMENDSGSSDRLV